jgi:probable DNA metabolism protein
MLGRPDVAALLDAEKHLLKEAQLLKGFVRFSDFGGVLASTITPKNFILPFIANHFCSRYSGEEFIIFDKNHKAALIYKDRRREIISLEDLPFPEADEAEEQYQALWKSYYHTVAIEARTNPRCRMTHLPKRYWGNMTEMRELL